jgi:hypothetical protein
MKTKVLLIRNIIFWAIIVNFVLLVKIAFIFRKLSWVRLPGVMRLYLAFVLLVLAAVMVVLTIKVKEARIRKFFFILTGASALGIPVFAVLHNLVFALCTKFGCAYWPKGGDEPVFFILAVFVCPALFLLGILGSIVVLIYGRLRKNAG